MEEHIGIRTLPRLAALGLTSEASDADIKKAYRKLSLKYHPGACRALVSALFDRNTRLPASAESPWPR